jgi:hypothetical protein
LAQVRGVKASPFRCTKPFKYFSLNLAKMPPLGLTNLAMSDTGASLLESANGYLLASPFHCP